MSNESELVRALSRFNRKERFWLLHKALGAPFGVLDRGFLDELGRSLGISIPSSPWWSFDYHFDWLHAVLHRGPSYHFEPPFADVDNDLDFISGSHEDIDFIIAFDQTIILIEAKLSASWNNKQMRSKATRMRSLPGDNVKMHLVLASPQAPKGLKDIQWPQWAIEGRTDGMPRHIKFDYNKDQSGRLMVTRRTSDNKKYYVVKSVYK